MNQLISIQRDFSTSLSRAITLVMAISVVEMFCQFHSFILEAVTCFAIWKTLLILWNTLSANFKTNRSHEKAKAC